jgi:hypothetical protein
VLQALTRRCLGLGARRRASATRTSVRLCLMRRYASSEAKRPLRRALVATVHVISNIRASICSRSPLTRATSGYKYVRRAVRADDEAGHAPHAYTTSARVRTKSTRHFLCGLRGWSRRALYRRASVETSVSTASTSRSDASTITRRAERCTSQAQRRRAEGRPAQPRDAGAGRRARVPRDLSAASPRRRPSGPATECQGPAGYCEDESWARSPLSPTSRSGRGRTCSCRTCRSACRASAGCSCPCAPAADGRGARRFTLHPFGAWSANLPVAHLCLLTCPLSAIMLRTSSGA